MVWSIMKRAAKVVPNDFEIVTHHQSPPKELDWPERATLLGWSGQTLTITIRYCLFQHKYQLSLDGTVAAYRLPFLLAGGSTVLKQDSPYFEHFYNQLQPWVHYVPVDRDLDNLKDRLAWLDANEKDARKMASEARQFARQHLMPQNTLCYHAQLLRHWTLLLKKRSLDSLVKTMDKVDKLDEDTLRRVHCLCGDHPKSSGRHRDEL